MMRFDISFICVAAIFLAAVMFLTGYEDELDRRSEQQISRIHAR